MPCGFCSHHAAAFFWTSSGKSLNVADACIFLTFSFPPPHSWPLSSSCAAKGMIFAPARADPSASGIAPRQWRPCTRTCVRAFPRRLMCG